MNSLEKQNHNFIVVKFFIRVLKNNDLYNMFTKTYMSMVSDCIDNPFGKCRNLLEFSELLGNFTDTHDLPKKMNDKHIKITMMINHLLHYFLERNGIHPFKLSKYGQEIYNLVCCYLYGNEYVENENKHLNELCIPDPRNEKEAYVIGMYLNEYNNSNFNGTFIDFKNKLELDNNKSYDKIIFNN